MFNATELLGRLLQSGLSGSTDQRLGHAMGPSGLGQGNNPLSDIFSQISGALGQGRQGPGASAGSGGLGGGLGGSLGGGLGGLADMAESVLGQATGAVRGGNPLAVGGLAALAGALLGGGGDATRGALGGGLLAVLGSLAYSALKSRASAAGASADTALPPPVGLIEPQTPADEQALNDLASLVVRAMINAAKADGEIDATEKQRILGKLAEDGADAEAHAFVEAEMHKSLDTAALVRDVAGRADVAIQVYAASLLAIEVDTPVEEEYLRTLAQALGLDAATVAQIHQTLGVPTTALV